MMGLLARERTIGNLTATGVFAAEAQRTPTKEFFIKKHSELCGEISFSGYGFAALYLTGEHHSTVNPKDPHSPIVSSSEQRENDRGHKTS